MYIPIFNQVTQHMLHAILLRNFEYFLPGMTFQVIGQQNQTPIPSLSFLRFTLDVANTHCIAVIIAAATHLPPVYHQYHVFAMGRFQKKRLDKKPDVDETWQAGKSSRNSGF